MTVHLQLMSHQKIGNNRIEFFSISYISICLFLDPGLVLCERPFVADLILYYLSLTEIYQQGKLAHLAPELNVRLNWLPGGKRWKRQALRQAGWGNVKEAHLAIFVSSSLSQLAFTRPAPAESWWWECFTCLHCWFMVIGLVISSSQCLHLLPVTTTNFLLIYDAMCFLNRFHGNPELTPFEYTDIWRLRALEIYFFSHNFFSSD